MANIHFTGNIQRHLRCPSDRVIGESISEVLQHYFQKVPAARGYVLDDQGEVRKHMVILIDGRPISDRADLSDPTTPDSEVYVFQALSGG